MKHMNQENTLGTRTRNLADSKERKFLEKVLFYSIFYISPKYEAGDCVVDLILFILHLITFPALSVFIELN